jgi:hypothetical protein
MLVLALWCGMLLVFRSAEVQFSSELFKRALRAAIHCRVNQINDECLEKLCQLPAAVLLSSKQVAAAPEAAVHASAGVTFHQAIMRAASSAAAQQG